MNLIDLESKLRLSFQNKLLLQEALTHRSYLNENPAYELSHNERLEFLGDAVLELIVTYHLFLHYPEAGEGKLTLLRSALVNTKMLSRVAREIGLQKYLLISKGEAQSNGRAMETILADAFEALVGAIYLDGGYGAVEEFINRFLLPHLPEIEKYRLYKDPKSLLQEIIQDKHKLTPVYKILEETGPDHERQFRVGVYFGDELKGEGIGFSKQEAEIDAAKKLLVKLNYKGTGQFFS